MAVAMDSNLRWALIDSFNSYALGVDSKDWTMVRRCFSDQVRIDYGALNAGEGSAVKPQSADSWVAHIQSVISGFDSTHHVISNHRVLVDGDRVNCRAYMVADHIIFPDPDVAVAGAQDICTVVGEYSNDYELQTDGVWSICTSRLVVKWSSGNPAVFQTAASRYHSG